MEIEREETLKRALRDGVNLFLGSGFSVLARRRPRPVALSSPKLRTWPTVFWGYSPQDAGTLEVLSSEGDLAGREQDMWILLSEMSAIAEQDYFRALGFSVLLGDTSALLFYLSDFVTSEVAPPTAVVTPASPTSRPALGPIEYVQSWGAARQPRRAVCA